MHKLIRFLVVIFCMAISFTALNQAVRASAGSPVIIVNDNVIDNNNSANINWNIDQNATCGIDYSINSDLSNGIGTNGHLVQEGLPSNDGKFYFVVNLTNLQPQTDYYYQVNCDLGTSTAQSEIKKLPKNTAQQSILTISVNENSINADNNADIYWNTNLEANCGIDFGTDSDTSKGIGTNGHIIQQGLPTNDGKFHYVVNLIGLLPNTDYYYTVNCSIGSDNTLYQSETKKLPKYIKTSKLSILVNGDNMILADNTAHISWNTDLEANCGIDYSKNSDLKNGIGTNGQIVQYGRTDNDGRFHYVVDLKNLDPGNDYFYRVNCNIGGDNTVYNSEIIKLKANLITNKIELSNIKIANLAGDSVKVTWDTSLETSYNGVYYNSFDLAKGWGELARHEYSMHHEVTLTQLEKNTQYKLRVYSYIYDGSANRKISDYIDFSTSGSDVYSGQKIEKVKELNPSEKENLRIQGSAKFISSDQFEIILSELQELKNLVKEQNVRIKYLEKLTKNVKKLTEKLENAINNFITYGVDENTRKLGEGERAAVMNSFKSAYGKLPETEAELTDAIKIANGRFPGATSANAEKMAKERFIKIYKRIADMNNANDSAAIKVMAYGLRQKAENRNLNSEKAGIKIFKAIYGHNPANTDEWNAMQAVTYSGSTKKTDTDHDLLPDYMEKNLGTNPLKADSDGDGYPDGTEVNSGYDPLKK